jgi:hypothetical protein
VPKGSAVGVDKWVRGALTGNGTQAVLRNAETEGVAGRIEVVEGDVRRLPFPDAAFDVVVSNFVVHEVDTEDLQLAPQVERCNVTAITLQESPGIMGRWTPEATDMKRKPHHRA